MVRREISAALERPGVHHIPVLVGGASRPTPGKLPSELTSILDWQWMTVRHTEFKRDVSELRRATKQYVPGNDRVAHPLGGGERGTIDIPKLAAARQPGAPAPRAILDEVIARRNVVLCFVFGEGQAADLVSSLAEDLTRKRECRAVQVIRVRDPNFLSEHEAAWLPSRGEILTIVGFDRRVSRKMTAAAATDAGDLLLAMLDAIAGK